MRVSLASSIVALLLGACHGDSPEEPSASGRGYRMGFSAIPPRLDPAVLVQTLELSSRRADAAIMHLSVPYADLLAGRTVAELLQRDDVGLANYYASKGLTLVVTLDVTDGLARDREAPDLVRLGRSITEPEVQAHYQEFAAGLAATLRPAYLGLAAETNLIRAAAPPPIYDAIVRMTNAAAADPAVRGSGAKLYVSVQVETAWGHLPPGAGYVGVERDLQDFPFVQALGLSSYPYFVYPDPEQIPLDYYVRIPGGRSLPLLVVEGGWPSASVGSIVSSPGEQARYLARQARLLDAGKVVFVSQLTFADLDLSTFPPPVPENLPLFASLGLVDSELRPKPSLAVWDSLFALRLVR